jgi:HEPN domain-containing protein
MQDKISLIKSWIEKAKKEMKTAERELKYEDPVIESVCFHSQQAVEKLIKGLLIFYNIEPEKTHSIGRLILKLPVTETTFHDKIEEFDILTDFAVELLYPDISEIPTLENAKSAFLLAKECLALVSARIELK